MRKRKSKTVATEKAKPGCAPVNYTAADVFYDVRVKKPGHKWHGSIVGLLTNGGVVAQVLRDNQTEFLKWREVVAV